MVDGHDLALEHDMDETKVRARVIEMVRRLAEGARLPADFECHLFLPGGLPFLNGTLMDYYDATDIKTEHRLYLVVTRRLGVNPSAVVGEVCDAANPAVKPLLSPLEQSTDAGLAQIACLLGYFQHDGAKTEQLLLVLAKITTFAPLVVNIFRFMEHEELNGLNVIAVTAPLWTYFSGRLLGPTVRPADVFSYALKCASYLTLLTDIEYLNLYVGTWSDATTNKDYLEYYARQNGHQQHFIIWTRDTTAPAFEPFKLGDQNFDDVNGIFDTVHYLKPLSPRSLHLVSSTAIMDNRPYPCLFLREVPGRRNTVEFMDPTAGHGRPKEDNIDRLANALGNQTVDAAILQIEPDRAEQAVVICFDASRSMNSKLDGYQARGDETITRLAFAKQYLHALLARTWAYRVGSCFGLIKFENRVETLCELTYDTMEFENRLNEVKPTGQTHLWDALSKAANALEAYNWYELDHGTGFDHTRAAIHPNAILRIIVISDGEDAGSRDKPEDVLTQKLLGLGIIVDAVVVSHSDDNEPLGALCEMTGGIVLKAPKTLQEGLDMFEQEAFLNMKLRSKIIPAKPPVTAAQFELKRQEWRGARKYTARVDNHGLKEACMATPLATPQYAVWLAKSRAANVAISKRSGRILQEIKYLANNASDDVVVWVNYANAEKIRAFIRAPPGSQYGDVFFSIFVTFPAQYPILPPVLRFTAAPYHPNISPEGKILFSLVDKEYQSVLRVFDILQGVRNLLATPELDEPLMAAIGQRYRADRAGYNGEARASAGRAGVANPDTFDVFKVQKYVDVPADAAVDGDDLVESQLTLTHRKPQPKVLPQPDDLLA
jgi:ubiquitin-conjugating enzyme E2 D/E